ncbi:MAG: hypothetical protein IE922_13670 [Sphingomonadales bacterium]|nr:hypothetical protein [Sphingomonadales bacterium]
MTLDLVLQLGPIRIARPGPQEPEAGADAGGVAGGEPGADLVIAFASVGHDPARGPSPEFVATALGRGRPAGAAPRRALFVMDDSRSWGNAPEFAPALRAALADEAARAPLGRVAAIGQSMGGYAACAFSAACPGADVVAISPQSTLDKTIVPWETRYKVAWDRDFSGKYGDAAQASHAARKVTILYDPYEPLDAGHVDRFTGSNVMKLRTPLMGHRLGSSLHQMGLLSPILLAALDGSLTEADFHRLLRARRDFPRYQRELFQRAVAKGHKTLARRMGESVLKRNDNRAIRLGLHEL